MPKVLHFFITKLVYKNSSQSLKSEVAESNSTVGRLSRGVDAKICDLKAGSLREWRSSQSSVICKDTDTVTATCVQTLQPLPFCRLQLLAIHSN